jgi:amino acid transporter
MASQLQYKQCTFAHLITGGHVGMVFGWLIPCLFVMPIALSMAELASAMP